MNYKRRFSNIQFSGKDENSDGEGESEDGNQSHKDSFDQSNSFSQQQDVQYQQQPYHDNSPVPGMMRVHSGSSVVSNNRTAAEYSNSPGSFQLRDPLLRLRHPHHLSLQPVTGEKFDHAGGGDQMHMYDAHGANQDMRQAAGRPTIVPSNLNSHGRNASWNYMPREKLSLKPNVLSKPASYNQINRGTTTPLTPTSSSLSAHLHHYASQQQQQQQQPNLHQKRQNQQEDQLNTEKDDSGGDKSLSTQSKGTIDGYEKEKGKNIDSLQMSPGMSGDSLQFNKRPKLTVKIPKEECDVMPNNALSHSLKRTKSSPDSLTIKSGNGLDNADHSRNSTITNKPAMSAIGSLPNENHSSSGSSSISHSNSRSSMSSAQAPSAGAYFLPPPSPSALYSGGPNFSNRITGISSSGLGASSRDESALSTVSPSTYIRDLLPSPLQYSNELFSSLPLERGGGQLSAGLQRGMHLPLSPSMATHFGMSATSSGHVGGNGNVNGGNEHDSNSELSQNGNKEGNKKK